jgi:hypothetical protein
MGGVARPRRPLTPETRELLDQAWAAHLEAEQARWRRDALALNAAAHGATWREVGAAVGMSPQAAHERYHHQLQTDQRPQ